MGRPITWQDVAGPAQTPGILLAANQATKTLTDNIGGMGDVLRQVGADQKQAATGAAVAAIASSDDPTAMAAAIPKDNKFIDPLAVAGATNNRVDQIVDREIKGLQKEATTLEIDERQASLDDIKWTRESEDLAMPYREAALANKPFEIDKTDPRWSTAAGQRAMTLIDGWQKSAREQKRLDEELQIRKNAAARDAKNDAERIKQQNFLNEVVRYHGNEGAAEDAAIQERWLVDYATSQGMGHLLGAGRDMAKTTLQGNVPTEQERSAPNRYGVSAKDVEEVNAARAQVAIQKGNTAKAMYTDALKTGEELATNPYRETKADDMAAFAIFQGRNTDIGKSIFTKKWDSDDFKQRTQAIINEAKNEYKIDLPREVAYQLVEASSSSFAPLDSFGFLGNPAVVSGIQRYGALQKEGGLAQVQQNIANIDAATKASTDILDREVRAANLNARFGDKAPLPKTLEKAIKTDTGFKERAIRADIALLQQKLDSQYNQDSGYRMSKEASKTAAELDRKVAELRGLK